jgi:hypothetical protein
MAREAAAVRLRRAVFIALAAAAMIVAVPSLATAASPTKGATYRNGSFGDETMVELEVSRRGKGLAEVSIDMFMRCSNGIQELGSLLWLSLDPPIVGLLWRVAG